MRRAAFILSCLAVCLGLSVACRGALPEPPTVPDLETNAVIAFVGGANIVAMQESGHLESLITAAYPNHNLRFRNLAWEGDTVFAQPRDLNFPTLDKELRRVGATVIFVCFGQTEALQGVAGLAAFQAAYENTISQYQAITPNVVLVTPVPFEVTEPPLPNLAAKNGELKQYVGAILLAGRQHKLRVVDLFSQQVAHMRAELRQTKDGLHLTPIGQALVALDIARTLGLPFPIQGTSRFHLATGAWSDPALENLRLEIVRKNRLWFDYWRPMNWAFLAGDRTEQPSSRDHRDPKIRWFPQEMEKFTPLIEQSEKRIQQLARSVSAP